MHFGTVRSVGPVANVMAGGGDTYRAVCHVFIRTVSSFLPAANIMAGGDSYHAVCHVMYFSAQRGPLSPPAIVPTSDDGGHLRWRSGGYVHWRHARLFMAVQW